MPATSTKAAAEGSRPVGDAGLRDLVQNLRTTHTRQTRAMGAAGFRGWHERGRLPHCDVPGRVQFVTFRLADSLPAEVLARLHRMEDRALSSRRMEAELDLGRGSCWSKRDDVGQIVEGALRHFHGTRYELRAWCIMPNHVHVLFMPMGTSMASIVDSWKTFTGREANLRIGRTGQRFWQADYFDVYARDAGHELRLRGYIEANPAKAKLVLDPKSWPWSSARFRDGNGILNLAASGPRSAAFQGAAAWSEQGASNVPATNAGLGVLRPRGPRSESTPQSPSQ